MNTKLKTLIVFTFLSALTVTASTGQEGKGGSPLKDRFRRVGLFLAYHLENNQVRLSSRLKDFEKFKKSVKDVPVQIVEKFPENIGKVSGEVLVAITIEDKTSPTGKTILLHEGRFSEALKTFEIGKESNVTILSNPNDVKIVTRENADKYFLSQSFLSFCFHEFLLAAGEDDSQTALSSLLSANHEGYKSWDKYVAGLKDRQIEMPLSIFWGPAVVSSGDSEANNQKALKLYYAEYAKQKMKEKFQAEVDLLVKGISTRVKIAKVIRSSGRPFLIPIRYDYKDADIGVYYTSWEWVKIILDTDKGVSCQEVPEGIGRIVGDTHRYRQFYDGKKLLFDKPSLENAVKIHEEALSSFQKNAQKDFSETSELIQNYYGDKYIAHTGLLEPSQFPSKIPVELGYLYLRDLLPSEGRGPYHVKEATQIDIFYKNKPWVCSF